MLSRDGKQVAFSVDLEAGRWELWQKSLIDGREAPIITDDYDRRYPQWSPDGAKIAYMRSKPNEHEHQIMVWSRESHGEEPLTTKTSATPLIFDWSSDGKWLLVSQWMMPLASAPQADVAARKILSDPRYDLWQPRRSPNGRWIAFEGVANTPTSAESCIYVVSSEGGAWT